MAQLQVAKIEAAVLPERYARGWHCLGLASDYTSKPVALDYFGTKLAAYRGEDGQVHILDGYCPHMGADLTLGCVEGNSLRCPFHSWRWGADGVCDDIPYAKRIPPKAVIKSWPTLEENNLLFVWNDPEGNPPIEEQRPPRIDACFSSDWSPWAIEMFDIHTNCRELLDNMADIGHFSPVHANHINTFKNISEGHIYEQVQTGSSDTLSAAGDGDEGLTSTATYYGPAYMVTHMTGSTGGVDVESRLLVSHVPIDTENFHLRFGVMIKKNPALTPEQNAEMVAAYTHLASEAFKQDVAIWHNKVRVDNPILCDGDGPIHKLRQWYQQFYVDAKDVPASTKERKEYVIR
jgi:3-ketosteroid 9alpha-monooxygenase subunit A